MPRASNRGMGEGGDKQCLEQSQSLVYTARPRDGDGPPRLTRSFATQPHWSTEPNTRWTGNKPTQIEVSAGEPHEVQAFMRVLGLHWCGADMRLDKLGDGEVVDVTYHLEVSDRWMNRGRLVRH